MLMSSLWRFLLWNMAAPLSICLLAAANSRRLRRAEAEGPGLRRLQHWRWKDDTRDGSNLQAPLDKILLRAIVSANQSAPAFRIPLPFHPPLQYPGYRLHLHPSSARGQQCNCLQFDFLRSVYHFYCICSSFYFSLFLLIF